jgi:uracil-DNA glycosylase
MKTVESKASDLDALLVEISKCRICRDAPTHHPPLPHEPRPIVQASLTARICVAGQAPGRRVHASGRPFSDASGARLRHWLGICEEDFYDPLKVAIVGMGFCFPGNDKKGGDLPPRRECAQIWRDELFSRMGSIELLILLGDYAQRWHLGREGVSDGLGGTIRNWRRIYAGSNLPRVVPLPHPSWRNTGWLKRNPWFAADLLPALRSDVASILRPNAAAALSDD